MSKGSFVRSASKKAELFEWFEKHCLWARRVDKDEMLSSTGSWQVHVATGANTSVVFGGSTLLDAIETAKGMCDE